MNLPIVSRVRQSYRLRFNPGTLAWSGRKPAFWPTVQQVWPGSFRAFLVVAWCWLLSACATPFATQPNSQANPVMLLGFDPVAYFTTGQPTRGKPEINTQLAQRTYYFATAHHKQLFDSNPAAYEPQYGGFCANGAPYRIKLGSDPTEFVVWNKRLFIFGDIIGKSFWLLDPAFNVQKADELWPAIADKGWRITTLSGWINRVPWYQDHPTLLAQFHKANPGKTLSFDPGGLWANLTKLPGWRAREGFGQDRLGMTGEPDENPAIPNAAK
jgi:hypothetical protein